MHRLAPSSAACTAASGSRTVVVRPRAYDCRRHVSSKGLGKRGFPVQGHQLILGSPRKVLEAMCRHLAKSGQSSSQVLIWTTNKAIEKHTQKKPNIIFPVIPTQSNENHGPSVCSNDLQGGMNGHCGFDLPSLYFLFSAAESQPLVCFVSFPPPCLSLKTRLSFFLCCWC